MTMRARKRVVIAGGGTAGWLAATALVRQLHGLVDVTLVESDEIGTVGVGESTIPTIRTFHQFIGVDEDAFIRATQATFKLGISFEGWDRPEATYFHAFGSVGRSTFVTDFQHFWLEAQRHGFAGAYGEYSLEYQAAARQRFALEREQSLAYAYHLDATAYARYLRAIAEPAGVRRVEGRITQVRQAAESGEITALVLQSGEEIPGDFFVDCTGFRALLIEDTLKTGFEDWSHWLPTDRAFAVQTTATEPPVPFTRAIAHGEGWRWKIPLQHRVGNGLVYSSAYLSDDEAHARLLAGITGEPLFDPRLVRFKTGMRRRPWNANCVSLGLASGFVEPLESTSIHLVMVAITLLIQHFPFGDDSTALAERFNTRSRREWEQVRDFIILHYHLTHRDDSAFWRSRQTLDIPESLASRIALFRQSAMAYQDQDELFRTDSWVEVMLGQGVVPASHHQLPATMPPAQLKAALHDLKRGIAAKIERLPAHATFLERYGAAGTGNR